MKKENLQKILLIKEETLKMREDAAPEMGPIFSLLLMLADSVIKQNEILIDVKGTICGEFCGDDCHGVCLDLQEKIDTLDKIWEA
jgi:hypothetical protein